MHLSRHTCVMEGRNYVEVCGGVYWSSGANYPKRLLRLRTRRGRSIQGSRGTPGMTFVDCYPGGAPDTFQGGPEGIAAKACDTLAASPKAVGKIGIFLLKPTGRKGERS